MFEKEIKFIYDFSINEVRRLGPFFTYEELTSADLHPAILKYISAELDYLIYEDRYKLLSNSNFDYSGSKIAEYFTLIGEEIKESKRFSFEYVDNLILHAISFNVNFLAQPKWALTKLIFEKEDVIKTAELRQIINYIYFHEYIKAIIEKYLLKKNLQMISRAEFETILDKLDQEILGPDPSKVFNLVLHAIGEFFNIGSVLKSKIPLYPFKLYLKEKKLQGYVAKLETTFKGDARQSFDIVEVQNVLFPQEVKKAPEQNKAARKAAVQKPVQAKTAEPKPAEPKPVEQKPAEQKPDVQPKPSVQNRENYLDRIVKQEKPASFFSFGKSRESGLGNESPEKVNVAENETPEVKENEMPVNNDAVAVIPESENPSPEKVEEIPVIEANSFVPAELISGETENPEDKDALHEESVVMELSEKGMPFEDLEFEEVEETGAADKSNAAEDKEEKTEDVFEGINIENIDLDIIDPDEQQVTENARESSPGFLSRFLKKGIRSEGGRKAELYERAKEDPEPPVNFDEEISIEEDSVPGQTEEAENTAVDSQPQAGDTFSRIFTVISEVFSKREQQKIISEIFANKPEKFAGTVYNIITEARDVYDAQRLMDSVLRANKIDLSSRWARVFKKNISKYFNQD